ncbi:MAG: NUDIX hydrolase [Verrucomicrobiota bacterium]
MNNPWTTHSSEQKYENPWIKVVENKVTDPGGNAGIYGVVHFANRAIGVIPIDDEDHTWLVGQYRYPLDTYEWEIIEGGAPEGEDPEEAARRELLEEAGIIATDYRLIIEEMQLSNSVCDERSWVFVARVVSVGESDPDSNEELALRRVPLETAFQMVANGEIRDSMSIAGLSRLQVERLGGV